MKDAVLITDFHLDENNRGTAALGYGSISFLKSRGFLKNGQTVVAIQKHNKIYVKDYLETFKFQDNEVDILYIKVNKVEYKLFQLFNFMLPWSKLAKVFKNVSLTAAINGGDGFSDIYGTKLFKVRLPEILASMKRNIPVVLLPQTVGPFELKPNLDLAVRIMNYSKAVFVRDKKFTNKLAELGIKYELTKDLSAYMLPEPWDIDIKPNSVGINVSGLAYSNNFLHLAGQFEAYPELIDRMIKHFRKKGVEVYLIPHSYCYGKPEPNNDDMWACEMAYNKLENKEGVTLVGNNLTPPQVKYVISKMKFFCGTRMHANFAAIYTDVPVYGLAYSYKFAGAFEANGLSAHQTYMINNMKASEIDSVISAVEEFYYRIDNK